MNEVTERKRGAWWGVAGWVVAILAALVALPWAASGRLPERLATHWGTGSGGPDGSMPLWAAALFPALIWVVLVLLIVALGRWRGGATSGPTVRGRPVMGLLSGGFLLVGAQASIVRANLDHTDWRQADSVSLWTVATLGVAAMAGLAEWAVARRDWAAASHAVASGTSMEIPAGERFVWLSRTTNPWLHWIGALAGLVALAAVLLAVSGLVDLPWAVVAPFATVSVAVLSCASVQARVTEKGLSVAFGPIGWPVRRWPAQDIESARAENRTPAQVGGWGYRLSGLGTTVMLRSGECLVIHPRRGREFAVSVDDAERGAALLNALSAQRPH
ncbi:MULTISPECIES: DUF1648 domain-containing protein [unclassified Streptomyces]|uniref:DUF1648 domain-containing protein n=1 Tax=unclassified Streptomyces TaxID=2593676 RepID=UPI002E162DD7|nr:DUF1648 domain-containing protein [Streptomyces sp. NBC_01296]WSW63279.1 DUF1648 domain-containing protein [Streptomyces sp. NBC_00998]